MFKVHRIVPTERGDIHIIASCSDHIQRTMDELNITKAILESVTDHDHTCMGCLKGW